MGSGNVVAIVGVGLIGGSIGLAMRRRDPDCRVVGIGRRESSLNEALRRGAITEATLDRAEGVAEADVIVVCTPVGRIVEDVCLAAEHCGDGALITDAGSTKGQIVRQLEQRLPPAARHIVSGEPAAAGSSSATRPGGVFIGSHPLAGSEKAGPSAARADLFDERVVVITPAAGDRHEDVERLSRFWESLGARVQRMDPETHDAVLACTSHAPHVIAAALAAATPADYLPLTAGGWRDTTRVAAGDPDLWRQILMSNRDHALKSLDEFAKTLSAFQRALATGDQAAIQQLLQAGKTRRDAVGS